MTNNQQNIIRKLQWIIYPIVVIMVVEFFIKFFNYAPFEASDNSNTPFEYIETGIMVLVLVTVSIGVLGLIQQFFTKELPRSFHAKDASAAKQLIKIDPPQQVGAQLLLFAVAIGFSVLLNIILFKPDFIFEPAQIKAFKLIEKVVFGFFYIIAHFLIIVFGQRLFKGMPPIFIATEKGFCY
ncbi:hypothetical protein [Sediminibacterium sp.]|uniref:hypothetical protein n=1 Tax=Sediminibacterium sp. TaxID=1917865 RepID=UPI0027330D14|nr:hypothetical protein [Sediminibacterium sp.]MDP3392449.1 hypothetical protein [Sediminibacterium sp.]MDP3565715.1 hypothetical protein [Sediminibacterium sp.]